MSDEALFDADETVRHLAGRWSGADTNILRVVFPLLASGHPVSVEAISRASGAPLSDVERALTRARASRTPSGDVSELSGLMLTPTVHLLDTGDVVLYACCALFALMVPRLLDRRIRIQSRDPISGQPIVVDASPDAIEHVDPPDARVGIVRTRRFDPAQDIAASFCTQVNYFAGLETAETWRTRRASRQVISLEALLATAAGLHRAVWA